MLLASERSLLWKLVDMFLVVAAWRQGEYPLSLCPIIELKALFRKPWTAEKKIEDTTYISGPSLATVTMDAEGNELHSQLGGTLH